MKAIDRGDKRKICVPVAREKEKEVTIAATALIEDVRERRCLETNGG